MGSFSFANSIPDIHMEETPEDSYEKTIEKVKNECVSIIFGLEKECGGIVKKTWDKFSKDCIKEMISPDHRKNVKISFYVANLHLLLAFEKKRDKGEITTEEHVEQILSSIDKECSEFVKDLQENFLE